MSDREIQDRLESAIVFARDAGRGIVRRFTEMMNRSAAHPEIKDDGTPVTIADREAECLIRDAIAAKYPHDGVLGEEFGEASGSSGVRWVIDPIDGTLSFVCGVPLYGTLIGIERGGVPVAGVIHLPSLGETVSGGHGLGAMHHIDGQEVRQASVSTVETVTQAMFVTTSMNYFIDAGRVALYADLVQSTRITRGFGDAYAFALIATGRADVCVELGVKPWDIAAVGPVIAGAGGRWSDFDGSMKTDQGCIVATNGVLHRSVLDLIARTAR